MSIEFRVPTTAEDLAALPILERNVWGSGAEPVSTHMLIATIAEGGVAIGAYDDGRLVGSVYGFRTMEADVLHSHYLAVDPAYRRGGLGIELKQRQRAWCLDHGIRAMRWTFDPLQVNNAHLNLNRLGAVGITYHVNHYGVLGGINGSLPSDRLTVQWALTGEREQPTETTTIEIPAVSPDDVAASNDAALTARLQLRERLHPLVSAGWRVVGVDRDRLTYTVGRIAAG